MTALSDCNEWGAIYILDALTNYNPSDAKETERYIKIFIKFIIGLLNIIFL